MAHDENGRTTVVSFRVAEYERHLLQAAASRRGLFLAEWIRKAAIEALRRELLPTVDGVPHVER